MNNQPVAEPVVDWAAVHRASIARSDAFLSALKDFSKPLLIDLIADLSSADTPDRLVAWLRPRARVQRAQEEVDALSSQLAGLRKELHKLPPFTPRWKAMMAVIRETETEWSRAHAEVMTALEDLRTNHGGLPR